MNIVDVCSVSSMKCFRSFWTVWPVSCFLYFRSAVGVSGVPLRVSKIQRLPSRESRLVSDGLRACVPNC